MDALGHRLRVDACVGCGRRDVFGRGPLIVDVEAGGLVCEACANAVPGLLRLGSGSVATLPRLRGLAWDEAGWQRLGSAEAGARPPPHHPAGLIRGPPMRP